MTLLSPDQILIGNDAGWLLQFEIETVRTQQSVEPNVPLILSSDQYYAEINATLPHGLAGGTYTFTIEGLIDEHYRQLKQIESNPNSFVNLYLFWRETNASVSSYLANLTGLTGLTNQLGHISADPVAVLKITGVSRKAGDRYYETTIEAQERVFCALSKRISNSLYRDTHQALLEQEVFAQTGIEIQTDGLINGMLPSAEGIKSLFSFLTAGSTYVSDIQEMAREMEQATGKYGRGMLLIRDGILQFGTRSNLMGTRNLKPLSLQNGLVESQMTGLVNTDPYFNPQTNPFEPPKRKQFSLTLKGRPDIKPGDFVQFAPPPEDLLTTTPSFGAAMAGAFQAPIVPELEADFQNAVTMYVTAVNHKLGKNHGFVTSVAGVEADPTDPWDRHSPQGSRPRDAGQSGPPVTEPEDQVVDAIQENIQTAIEALHLTEVGEVRGTQTSGAGSQTEFPGQTLTVFEGLQEPVGYSNQAHRLPIQRENPQIRQGMAYASPFAWGKCGLVLPRYPGTRIVMTHRNGQRLDPIDIGALWEAGHGPDSEPGDWWLILPVDIPEDQRSSIANEVVPEEHTGPVTQDLIDAGGNRIIEVGELTIRVGRDSLKNSGERPERAEEENSVTIEHTQEGAKIVMKPDGTIVISGKNIELDAGTGTITLKADTVDVQVSREMNVH